MAADVDPVVVGAGLDRQGRVGEPAATRGFGSRPRPDAGQAIESSTQVIRIRMAVCLRVTTRVGRGAAEGGFDHVSLVVVGDIHERYLGGEGGAGAMQLQDFHQEIGDVVGRQGSRSVCAEVEEAPPAHGRTPTRRPVAALPRARHVSPPPPASGRDPARHECWARSTNSAIVSPRARRCRPRLRVRTYRSRANLSDCWWGGLLHRGVNWRGRPRPRGSPVGGLPRSAVVDRGFLGTAAGGRAPAPSPWSAAEGVGHPPPDLLPVSSAGAFPDRRCDLEVPHPTGTKSAR